MYINLLYRLMSAKGVFIYQCHIKSLYLAKKQVKSQLALSNNEASVTQFQCLYKRNKLHRQHKHIQINTTTT